MTIDTSMLTAMRDAIETLLPDTCNILSATEAADGQGGIIKTWGTSGTSISCRMDTIQGQRQGMEKVTAAAMQPYITYMLSIPYDTTITEKNRVEHNSDTFTVKSINENQSWIAVKRVELEKI